MPRKVELSAYNPGWADEYLLEAKRLTAILSAEILAIHHIGSTAIPKIYAKPIIDILIVVKDIERIEHYNDQMAALDYAARGENGIPGRRYFSKEIQGTRTHHVHIFQVGNPEIDRHVKFRDYLLRHSEEAQAYSRLKCELAKIYSDNVLHYSEAKSDFIHDIDERNKLA